MPLSTLADTARSTPPSAPTIDLAAAGRDEFRRLVEQLPDEQVSAALAEVRRLAEPPPAVDWPPPWFGLTTGRSDTAAHADEVLADGFGR